MTARCKINVYDFITLVKENAALWDCRLDDYKLAENKPKAWQAIADQVGSEFAHFSLDSLYGCMSVFVRRRTLLSVGYVCRVLL